MKHLAKTDTNSNESGFTIVELMIATVVFSLVLLVIIYGVLNFSRAYYGGVNSTATQSTTRSIVNTTAQAIEFSGNFIVPSAAVVGHANTYYFCAGGNTYYYIQGVEYTGLSLTDPSFLNAPGLFVQPGSCTNSPDPTKPGSKELLSANMRITYLQVTQDPTNARLFTIQLGLAYGDGDLLCTAHEYRWQHRVTTTGNSRGHARPAGGFACGVHHSAWGTLTPGVCVVLSCKGRKPKPEGLQSRRHDAKEGDVDRSDSPHQAADRIGRLRSLRRSGVRSRAAR